jgi:hypothetical protein
VQVLVLVGREMLRVTNDKEDDLKLKRILKLQAAGEARSDNSGNFANPQIHQNRSAPEHTGGDAAGGVVPAA